MTRLNSTATLVVATTLVGCALTFPALGAKTLLRCTVNDAVTLQDDGTLSRDDNIAKGAKTGDYIINVTTGAVKFCMPASDYCVDNYNGPWIIARQGGAGNDTVLVTSAPIASVRENPAIALVYAATDFIRIGQWKGQPKILFQRFTISTLASGTCRPVK
jgi:hypothetical protein